MANSEEKEYTIGSKMKLGARLLLPFFILLVLPQVVLAHPGNTAADGCHYCRTNCAKWGEVEGARHCHGGYSVAPVNTKTPAPTRKPNATSTPKPTKTPTLTKAPTATLTSTPTQTLVITNEPSVQGAADIQNENSPTPTPKVLTKGDNATAAGIAFTFALIPTWLVYRFLKKNRVQH